MKTNNTESKYYPAPALGQATVSASNELFVGIDTAKTWQVVTRFVPGEGAKPSEKMTVEVLLRRVAGWIKQGLKRNLISQRPQLLLVERKKVGFPLK